MTLFTNVQGYHIISYHEKNKAKFSVGSEMQVIVFVIVQV